MTDQTALMPIEHIAQSILILRGHRVLLDGDLAALYRVTTKRLNQQVRRNLGRFPSDFMFQLNANETEALRLQFATLRRDGASTASTCLSCSRSTAPSWRQRS